MSSHLDILTATMRALRFPTLTTATWFGRPALRLAPPVRRVLTPELAVAGVEYLLNQHLYAHLYTTGVPIPALERPSAPRQAVRTAFVDRLSHANTGAGRWEPGWELTHVEDGSVVIRSGGISVSADAAALRTPTAGHRIGDAVRLHRPKEFTSLSPGFYVAVGDAAGPADGGHLVRWYWNLVPGGAAPLVRALTERLNGTGTAFQLKVLTHPESYRRCDAGVLYVAQADVPAVAATVVEVLPLLRPHLKDGVPAFTKRMAPGLGMAEDPGGGESFGQHRCRLLAGGLMLAQARGEKAETARMKTVLDHLVENGLDITAPYLNAGSVDDYALPTPPRRTGRGGPTTFTPPSTTGLDTAAAIGTRLSHQTITHADECTWLAPVRGVAHDLGGPGIPLEHTYRPVGAGLYDGAAGIAWFLGELHTATGDSAHRRAALGGIRHALRLTENAGPAGPAGLFDGATGVALAAARLGTVMGKDELLTHARRVALGISVRRDGQCQDLLAGTAGIVVGLLALDTILDDQVLAEHALTLGEVLLREAEVGPEGTSWRWPPELCHRNLTGYSHGTAGITHALLELFARSGDHRFRDTAEQARAYDRAAFDPGLGNWADYRRPAGRRRRWALRPATAWCHGAPGIAVARLRALVLSGNPDDRDDAVVALTATGAALKNALAASTPEFGLCHGLAGIIEILQHGERTVSQPEQVTCDYEPVVRHGVARYGARDQASADPPGLMAGLAGIGAFYLRQARPDVPSPLLVGPATEWAVAAPGLNGRAA